MRELGAELIEEGDDFQAALEHATKLEQENGWHWVPSYHPLLVTGVATAALEFLSAVPELDTVYVPIGMGSGDQRHDCGAGCPRSQDPKSSGSSRSMLRRLRCRLRLDRWLSIRRRRVLRMGSPAGGRRIRRIEVVRAGVDRILEVDDDEVEAGDASLLLPIPTTSPKVQVQWGWRGCCRIAPRGGSRVGTVLGGGNVDSDVFAEVLHRAEGAAESGISALAAG